MNINLEQLFDTEPAEEVDDAGDAGQLFEDDDDDANVNDDNEKSTQQKKDDVDVEVGDVQQKKKRISRPQPKLNGDRLCGARGIGVMEEVFSDLVFTGRGHEREDLRLLMAKMQHWAHRLFPKMPFDQTIERIEKLGKTKQVQVNVKKVRMGMNMLPTEVTPDEDLAHGESERDVFDELIGSSASAAAPPPSSPPPPVASNCLTEEQQERMRKNREAAQLRRMRAQFSQQQQLLGVQRDPQPSDRISAEPDDTRADRPGSAAGTVLPTAVSAASSQPADDGGLPEPSQDSSAGVRLAGGCPDADEDAASRSRIGDCHQTETESTAVPDDSRAAGLPAEGHQMSESRTVLISDDRQMTAVSDDQQMTHGTDDRQMTAVSDDKQMTDSTDDQMVLV